MTSTPAERAAATRARYPDLEAPEHAPDCPVDGQPCIMGCRRPWCHYRQAVDGAAPGVEQGVSR